MNSKTRCSEMMRFHSFKAVTQAYNFTRPMTCSRPSTFQSMTVSRGTSTPKHRTSPVGEMSTNLRGDPRSQNFESPEFMSIMETSDIPICLKSAKRVPRSASYMHLRKLESSQMRLKVPWSESTFWNNLVKRSADLIYSIALVALYGGEGVFCRFLPFPRWRLRVEEFSSSHLRLPCLFPNLALPRVDSPSGLASQTWPCHILGSYKGCFLRKPVPARSAIDLLCQVDCDFGQRPRVRQVDKQCNSSDVSCGGIAGSSCGRDRYLRASWVPLLRVACSLEASCTSGAVGRVDGLWHASA